MELVCINNKTSDKIRGIVRRILDKNIYLKKLEFHSYLLIVSKSYLKSVLLCKRVKSKRDKV
jgi:endonuclease III-like uncharacterized protein